MAVNAMDDADTFHGDEALGEGVLNTRDGVGPLTQRDYVAVVEGSTCTPTETRDRLLAEFPRFSPDTLARFTRPGGADHPLRLNDEMRVWIRTQGEHPVVVSHIDAHSLTLRTVGEHPEAGRISFGASRDEAGRLVLRIRSRARINGPLRWLGYEAVGKHAQTAVWVTFLQRLAEACGGTIRGEVVLSTDRVEDSLADEGKRDHATFQTHAR